MSDQRSGRHCHSTNVMDLEGRSRCQESTQRITISACPTRLATKSKRLRALESGWMEHCRRSRRYRVCIRCRTRFQCRLRLQPRRRESPLHTQSISSSTAQIKMTLSLLQHIRAALLKLCLAGDLDGDSYGNGQTDRLVTCTLKWTLVRGLCTKECSVG